MSPRAPEKVNHGAYNAALVAFQNSRHKAAMKQTKGQDGSRLTPPKARGGIGDTGHHSKNKDEENIYQKSLTLGPKAGWKSERQDGLVVWRLSPNVEQNAENGKERVLQLQQNKDLSPVKIYYPPPNITQRYARGETAEVVSPTKEAPRPGTPQPSIRQVLIRVVQTIWWFVEPAFEPDSAVRKRWEQGRLTWKDIGRFLAAVLFIAMSLMITAGIVRIIGVIFQTLKGFLEVFRFITGLGS
jgi:hypothetical protein